MSYRKGTLEDLKAFQVRKNDFDRQLYEVWVKLYSDEEKQDLIDDYKYGGAHTLKECTKLLEEAEKEVSKNMQKKSSKIYILHLKEYRVYDYWGDGWNIIETRTNYPLQAKE